MAALIKLQGGPQNFIDRLDFIIDNVCHLPSCEEALLSISSGIL
jgi:hypothetical protein